MKSDFQQQMAATRNKLKPLDSARLRWTFVLRCFLVVAAWQGPMPWCDFHGTLANSPEQLSPDLAVHLRSHHANIDPLSKVLIGWHLHVDIPGSSEEDARPSTKHGQDLPPLTNPADDLTTSVTAADFGAWSSVGIESELVQESRLIAALSHSQRTAHFLDTFAPTLSVPLRLCVSVC